MPDLSPDALQIAAEIAAIAAAPVRIEERAEALLESLHRLVPFEGAVIHLLDPERKALRQVVSRGYDTPTTSTFLTGSVIADEIEMLGFTRRRAALRVSDLPIPLEQLQGWTDYLRPAEFRGGLVMGMFDPCGRYLGVLALHTDTITPPTEAARDLLTALAPLIATAIDPLRSSAAMAGLVTDAYAGIVLTRSGKPLPLPGLPSHDLLIDGLDLLTVAAEHVVTGHLHSFLCPDPDDGTGPPTKITILACPADAPPSLLAVVLLSPPGELHGLTPRELEILGLLVEGWPNRRIAAALFITPRTVATHVEHILIKLDAPTRTLAVVRALRLGLYVPAPTPRGPQDPR